MYQVIKDAAWIHKKKLEKIDKITWSALGILELSLALRLGLNTLNPNAQSTFAAYVHNITGVIVAPFGVLLGISAFSYSRYELATLLAMSAYAVVCWIILNINGNKMAGITLHYQQVGIQPTDVNTKLSV